MRVNKNKGNSLMEEYLTVKELSSRIKFSKQSLYNIIHKGGFILGKHYLKPTPKKILFKWSEIQIWMGEISCPSTVETSKFINQNEIINHRTHIGPKSLIKI
jgi:hypothetical protein